VNFMTELDALSVEGQRTAVIVAVGCHERQIVKGPGDAMLVSECPPHGEGLSVCRLCPRVVALDMRDAPEAGVTQRDHSPVAEILGENDSFSSKCAGPVEVAAIEREITQAAEGGCSPLDIAVRTREVQALCQQCLRPFKVQLALCEHGGDE